MISKKGLANSTSNKFMTYYLLIIGVQNNNIQNPTEDHLLKWAHCQNIIIIIIIIIVIIIIIIIFTISVSYIIIISELV